MPDTTDDTQVQDILRRADQVGVLVITPANAATIRAALPVRDVYHGHPTPWRILRARRHWDIARALLANGRPRAAAHRTSVALDVLDAHPTPQQHKAAASMLAALTARDAS